MVFLFDLLNLGQFRWLRRGFDDTGGVELFVSLGEFLVAIDERLTCLRYSA